MLNPPSLNAQAWDKAADGWNHHAAPIAAWLANVTAAMIDAAQIGIGSSVLDIAAGAGNQTLDIARRVGSKGYVLATDVSPHSLTLAKDNAWTCGLAHIQIRVADAQALGLAGSNFDAAVSRLGLMFCAAPLQALASARAALKPGGRLAVVVFSTPQNNPCLTVMMGAALKAAGAAAQSPYAPGTLLSLGQPGLMAKLLGDAGFGDINVQAVSAPFQLASAWHYVDFVRSSGSPIMQILASLDAKAQDAAWADMVAKLDVFTTASGWVGPNELLLCSATAPG